ncbi:hypothetical protein SLS58_001783 [Diplodia intermedia]|uniref:Lytic polysaccharide monooxygenase n=1 Tax=Diplodia intermedia TaxID=856260 RepID=A0ABR3U0X5_9PEZI
MAVNEDQISQPAVHGGGTCQLSISLDVPPKKDSTFKVIKTIEGGCPGLDSKPENFTYQIPQSIPSGKAVFAWTWFPVSSGTPEMYMNCAPIKVTGGAQDTTDFVQLPDILVANYSPVNCTRNGTENQVMKVFNPGVVLEYGPTPSTISLPTATPVGDECPTADLASAASITSQPLAAGTPTSVAAGQPGAAGGALVETAVSGSSEAASAAGPSTTLATTTASASSQAASGNAAVAAGQADTPAAATPTDDGSASDGQCGSSNNGQLVCNGSSHFGFCNWGKITWQSVADGTVCENGTIKAATAARMKERRAAHVHAHGRLSGGRQFHA